MVEATPKLVVFLAAHVCILILVGTLLAHFQPDPDGFRLSEVDALASFGVLTAPPLVIGMIARSRLAVGLIAGAHALSPLSLVHAMRHSDLDFAVILWWVPLPLLVAFVVAADLARQSRCRA